MRKKKRGNWYRVHWVENWYWYDKNVIDFRWSDSKGEEIAKVKLIESLQKQADEKIILTKVTGGLFDYYCIVPKEKKKISGKSISK